MAEKNRNVQEARVLFNSGKGFIVCMVKQSISFAIVNFNLPNGKSVAEA